MKSSVVVTGAAGFIGGQTALRLNAAGYSVVGIDRKWRSDQLANAFDQFVQSDIADALAQHTILETQPIAIVHCAGTSLVGPSVANPAEYYNNNVVKTLELLDIVRKSLPCCKFIFSSRMV